MPIPPMAANEARVIFAQHPAVLIEQIHAMTERLHGSSHQLSIFASLPGGEAEWVAAIIEPGNLVDDGD